MKRELNYEKMFKKLMVRICQERERASKNHDLETDSKKAKMYHGMWLALDEIEVFGSEMMLYGVDDELVEDIGDYKEEFAEEYKDFGV